MGWITPKVADGADGVELDELKRSLQNLSPASHAAQQPRRMELVGWKDVSIFVTNVRRGM